MSLIVCRIAHGRLRAIGRRYLLERGLLGSHQRQGRADSRGEGQNRQKFFAPLEIDLIAYRATSNELLALECKSYLDSGGVHAAHFLPGSKYAHRYKLFHDPVLRETVLERLRLQCVELGLCPADVTVRLGLIHGHVTSHNAPLLAKIFENEGWLLFGPDWLKAHLGRMSDGGYENSTAAIVAKILLRPRSDGSAAGSRDTGTIDHLASRVSDEKE
jgi:hypothetical protein